MPAGTRPRFDRSDLPGRGSASSLAVRAREVSHSVTATALDSQLPVWNRFSPLLLLTILSTLPLVAVTSGAGSLFGAWLVVAYLLSGYLWVDRAVARADRSHQWRAFVLAGGGISIVSLGLPALSGSIVGVGIGVIAIAAIWSGIRLHKPTRKLPWYLLASALALAEVGHLVAVAWETRAGTIPAAAGLISLAGLALLPIALSLILLRRSRGSSRTSLLDTAIVSSGFAILAWVYLIAPQVADPGSTMSERAVQYGWPLAGLAALIVTVRFLLSRWPDPIAPRQFAGSAIVLVIASLAATSWVDAVPTPATHPGTSGLWLLALVGFGATALHPAMGQLAAPIREHPEELTWQRTLLLTLALLLAPVTLLALLQRGERPTIEVIAGSSILLGILFAARFTALQRVRATSLTSERLLRRAATDLLGSDSRDEIIDIVVVAAQAIGGTRVSSSLYLSDGATGEFVEIQRHARSSDLHPSQIVRERDLSRSARRTLRSGTSVWLNADEIDNILGPQNDVDLVAVVPIRNTDGLCGLLVSSGNQLTPERIDHQEALCALLSLALDRQSFSGEPGRHPNQHAIHAKAADGTSFTFVPVVTTEPAGPERDNVDTVADSIPAASALSTTLRAAIEQDRLMVRYQPRLDLTRGRITSVEMTAAWESPIVGPIPGHALAAIAAEHGLSQPLRLGLLLRGCRQMIDWQTSHPSRTLDVVIPLSLAEIEPAGLAEDVGLALAESGCDPARLVLQFTAATLLDAGNATLRELSEIAAIGVSLAVSEAGASWSELDRLGTLPITMIEIEASLVHRIDSDDRAASIAEHLITLAHKRAARVAAHGVDRRESWVHLRKLGCDLGQGTLFSPPIDADGVATLLSRAEQRSSE